jgi:hypothetical protein
MPCSKDIFFLWKPLKTNVFLLYKGLKPYLFLREILRRISWPNHFKVLGNIGNPTSSPCFIFFRRWHPTHPTPTLPKPMFGSSCSTKIPNPNKQSFSFGGFLWFGLLSVCLGCHVMPACLAWRRGQRGWTRAKGQFRRHLTAKVWREGPFNSIEWSCPTLKLLHLTQPTSP